MKPVDVTVYDEGRRSGRVLYSGDLTASVTGGEVDLREYMIAGDKLDYVRDAWGEVIDAIASVAVVMVEREDEDDA